MPEAQQSQDQDNEFVGAIWRPASAYNQNKSRVTRAWLFVKRRLKIDRFFLVFDLKRGVSIAALCLIVSTNLCYVSVSAVVCFGD